MSDVAIRVRGLSKCYRIGRQREKYSTIREALVRAAVEQVHAAQSWWSSDFNGARPDWFWALQDINLEVKQGEVFGIIGRNGAGKSTLLKVLAGITQPTAGYADLYGRVGSLLEVGTGFHSELTGRENIYMNGALLGMSRNEIKCKFDDIVEFAETEKFIDTPVKHYSSGMYMRLAFAVAAHLETEILIIDEVLAVGDVQFQKRCLGKMQDMAQDQGRTVLFVSHNMDAIQRLCSRCVLLDSGKINAVDRPSSIVARYLGSDTFKAVPNSWIDISNVRRSGGGKEVRFVAVKYSGLNEALFFQPYSNGPLEFCLRIESRSSQSVGSLAVTVRDRNGMPLVNADTYSAGDIIDLREGENTVRLRIHRLFLNPGSYLLGLWLDRTGKSAGEDALDFVESAFEINVIRANHQTLGLPEAGPVICQFEVLEVTSTNLSRPKPKPN
jgi:lipopolysaccharide transport system ATP-binding protein